MPHLNADALATDPDGLAFLRAVLDGPAPITQVPGALGHPFAPPADAPAPARGAVTQIEPGGSSSVPGFETIA